MAVSSAAPARMQILIGASWPQYVIGQSDPESRTMMRIPQSSPQLVAPAKAGAHLADRSVTRGSVWPRRRDSSARLRGGEMGPGFRRDDISRYEAAPQPLIVRRSAASFSPGTQR